MYNTQIEGDTLYNVLKIGDVDVDESDRPIDPPRILSTEVLWNPYDDIVPRTTREERLRAEQERRCVREAFAFVFCGKFIHVRAFALNFDCLSTHVYM